MLSNCLLWARSAYKQRLARWKARGSPPGQEPRRWWRESRLAPSIKHHGVSYHDSDSGLMVDESFVPLDTKPLRWWQLWRVVLFRGRVRRGDSPEH